MPPALKARVLRNISSNTPTIGKTQANGPERNKTQVDITQVAVQPIPSESLEAVNPGQSSQPTLTTESSGDQTALIASDVVSHASTLSEAPDFQADDVSSPGSGPWVVIDHSGGEMIVDEGGVATEAPTGPSDSSTQVEINPASGIPALVETPPPALLFQDMDVRPDWLIRSINHCLQYAPYYMCLNEVVDLFLTQEARLGYLNRVSTSRSPSTPAY